MNHEHWTEDDALRLREILADPVMKKAISRISEETVPEPGTVFRLTTEQAAIRMGHVAGRADFLRSLRGLSQPPKDTGVAPLPEEWGYLTPTTDQNV